MPRKPAKKTVKKTRSKNVSPGKPSSLVDTRIIYCGDNLEQLKKLPDACIDLIYIDPPFNSNRNYEVFWGETKEKRSFEDRHESTQAYIDFMRPRCVELARVLKKTGSFYYHCDWHASHYVKIMLDQIFGENSFINEIVWTYESGGRATHHFHRKHDILFLYSPTAEKQKYTFNGLAVGIPRNKCDACGTILEKWNNLKREVDQDGRVYRTIKSHGKVYRYYDDEPVIPSDVWHISHLQQKDPERLGYPTQKPLTLLERIVKASSNPNDIVLDAFCGCGTALVAAENLGRQWVGIDISPTACRVMAKRLRDVLHVKEDENLWKKGHGFIIRNLPWTVEQLRKIPPFEFENWAVIELGGIPNKAKVGDMGIDGRIYPVSAMPAKTGAAAGELDFMDVWYPIQVKQHKAGRP
ncbi:MAG: site-specific DNA-methyltransferase, partial [Phycisphaerae bacterium]|nr:site-specific DNA-methyltransferase [Phycisphaerae bacterium]